MKTMTRRITAGFAATALAASLVACTESAQEDLEAAASSAAAAADEAASDAGSKVAEATEAVASQAAEATDAAASKAAEATDAVASKAAEAKDAMDSEMMSVNTGAGEVEVPASFAALVETKGAEWGSEVKSVEHNDKGYLANYGDNKLLVHNSETGNTVPVVGKIAETYLAQGGLDAEVGLPTEAEKTMPDAAGWIQEFTSGTISWVADATGNFGADVKTK